MLLNNYSIRSGGRVAMEQPVISYSIDWFWCIRLPFIYVNLYSCIIYQLGNIDTVDARLCT